MQSQQGTHELRGILHKTADASALAPALQVHRLALLDVAQLQIAYCATKSGILGDHGYFEIEVQTTKIQIDRAEQRRFAIHNNALRVQ